MKKNPDNPLRPLVAPRFACLGIRVGEVEVDASGDVMIGLAGMSVSADWRKLRPELIPEELDDGVNGARGRKMAVFVHGQGTGPFAEGLVAEDLDMCFKLGVTDAGFVRPARPVPLAKFEQDLVATLDGWVIDES